MKKIKNIFWSINTTFKISPLRFFVKIISMTLRSFVPIFVTLYIGNLLNQAYESTRESEVTTVILSVLMLMLLLIANSLLNHLVGLVNNRLNLKNSIKLKENFYKIFVNIPTIEFESSNFCDNFENAKNGYYNVIKITDGTLKVIIDMAATIYTLIIVCQASPYLSLVTIANFAIGY